jgi:ABC-2 type transport system ATP-binding protein
MTAHAIEVTGLRKSFGRIRALDGLDLEVAEGEVHGLVGPNGSGKTTALRVLLGLLRADGGLARLLGGHPWRDAVTLHRRVAYVPGEVTLWPNLTGGEVIDLLGRMRGGLDPGRRAELVARLDLDPTRRAHTYSKGNRQKVALVAALASDASLLVLDEPTTGLDPLMQAEFRRCVAEERRDGRTVLLSSHELAEVEAICDRVSIVRAGRTVESGTLDALRRRTRTGIVVEFGGTAPRLEGLPGVHGVTVEDRWLRCEIDPGAWGPVLAALAAADVRDVVSRPPSLEELFLAQWAEPADPAPAAAAGAR